MFIYWFVCQQSEELRSQLENEQHYCHVYRSQVSEVRQQMDESSRTARDLEQERASLLHQLQLAIARADSEAIARSVLYTHTSGNCYEEYILRLLSMYILR